MTSELYPSQVAANAMAQALFEKLQATTWPAMPKIRSDWSYDFGIATYMVRGSSDNQRVATAIVLVYMVGPDGEHKDLIGFWVDGYANGDVTIRYQYRSAGLPLRAIHVRLFDAEPEEVERIALDDVGSLVDNVIGTVRMFFEDQDKVTR